MRESRFTPRAGGVFHLKGKTQCTSGCSARLQDQNHPLPPLTRFDLEDVLALIAQKKYFLLHAPRQTGKTTCLLALADYLNQGGRHAQTDCNLPTVLPREFGGVA